MHAATGNAEGQLLALTESIHDAVVSAADDQGIVFWNAGAERLLGWTREEALGRPLTLLMPERYHTAHLAGMERVLAGAEPRLIGAGAVELQARHRDGHEIPVELSLGTFEDEGRRYFTGILRDIGPRLRRRALDAAQDRVRRAVVETGSVPAAAERIVRALGESLGWAVAGVWLRDDSGALRCTEMWTAEGIDGEAFAAISRALTLEPGRGLPGAALAHGAPLWVEDAAADPRFVRREAAAAAGLHAWLGIPMRAETELVGVVECFLPEAAAPDPELVEAMDALCAQLALVVLRGRAEDRLARHAADLERSNEELEQFASVASHDLSEPLRSISGFAALLERRYRDRLDDEADAFLTHIVSGAERMRRLIDGLLAYSRASRADLATERVDLGEVLDHVRRALAVALDESGADLAARGALPEVVGDAGRLDQVLQNLVANAIKFGGRRIEVASAREPGADAWRITVEDDGIGIAPAQADDLFEMFGRGAAGEDTPGEGIGLAVCRRIVERHGGRIGAEPRPEGGARFWFTLPAAR